MNDLYSNYIDTKCKYIYDGCELTLSKIISKHHGNLNEDNWLENIKLVSKEDMLYNLFDNCDLFTILQ